jgi:hypothetical protein
LLPIGPDNPCVTGKHKQKPYQQAQARPLYAILLLRSSRSLVHPRRGRSRYLGGRS